ncbi:MAG: OsmC family protein [Actinomycetota bacterium]
MTSTETKLNDVEIEAVGSLVGAIQDDPGKASTTWAAEVRWLGGFRSEAQIREFTPTPSDEPLGLGGADTAANPVEQLLGALGNCLAVGYAANATVLGIELNDVRIELDGDLDLHTFLGLTDGNAGFESIRARVHLDTDADQAELDELHAKVTSTSPVGHTLTRAVPVDIDLA